MIFIKKTIFTALYLSFIYWRNYCSILQIKDYYEKSDLNFFCSFAYHKYLFMDSDCFNDEKLNRSKFYDVLNFIPIKNKIFIEKILATKLPLVCNLCHIL